MRLKILILLFFIFQFFQLKAQLDNPDLIFELNVANDMLFFTDQYFSSGIELNVYAPFMNKSPFNKILIPHGKNTLNYYALTFTHNMYTPIYIDTLTIREIDHPFAAYILFGNRKESYHKTRRYKVTSEFQLGVIGSIAGGQVFQNTMHDNITIAGPVEGWENQINNDLCFQYSAQIEKGIANLEWMELNVFTGGKIGTPHSEAQLGIYGRFGYFDNYFQHIGINKKRNWQLWLFWAGDVNLIAYNAVLQGGMFNHRNAYALESINRILWHTKFGGTLVYKTFKLEIAQEVISPSFQTGQWHRWTFLSLMMGF